MPFSLLALIIFLIVYAIIAYGVYSSRKMQYDERQKYMQSIAYKYGFFTLILATAVNIVQSIFLFSLIGGINLYTGIMNQQEIISQHSPVKFNNINLISGILLLLADAIVITRAIMEHLQKEE